MAKKIKKKKRQSAKGTPQFLKGHKRIGKRFIPPFLQIPNISPSSWYIDRLPELIWLTLLSDQQGYQAAVNYAIKLSDIVNSVVEVEKRKCGFYMASDYLSLSEDERTQIISKMGEELNNAIDMSVGTILKFYPDFPMGWLVSEKWMKGTSIGLEGLDSIKNAVRTRIDRTSKPAMECQVLAWFMECKSGKVKFPMGMDIPDPNLISEYPNSDESKEMAARIRASLGAFVAMRERKSDWANSFWKHSFEISACEYPNEGASPRLPKSVDLSETLKIGAQFHSEVEAELQALWNRTRFDPREATKANVIAGLLSRNLQFASDIVQNPDLWRMPTGIILIRCMAETLIRLQWLIKCGKDKDYREYVEFGLGQEKLLLEHHKRIAQEDRPDRKAILDDIERREAWVNTQLYTFLLPVDVGGGPHGKDLRALSEEAGLLDLHRLVYSPFSSYVHGHWNAIARLNLSRCQNPLHADHHIPVVPPRPISFSCPIDAVNFYDDSYRLASEQLSGQQMESRAVGDYLANIASVFRELLDQAD